MATICTKCGLKRSDIGGHTCRYPLEPVLALSRIKSRVLGWEDREDEVQRLRNAMGNAVRLLGFMTNEKIAEASKILAKALEE